MMNNKNDNNVEHAELEKAHWTRFILPVLVIISALIIGIKLIKSEPKAKRLPNDIKKTFVEVITLEPQDHKVVFDIMGTVKPFIEIDLQARVAGEIVEVSPKLTSGACFVKDEIMLRIDPTDFEYAIVKCQAELASAEQAYKIELGEQRMGKYYWNMIEKKETNNALQSELTLRKPQLKKAITMMKSAQASLDDAQLDLARTVVKAPFNCVVVEESIDLGAQIAVNTIIANLVGTDEYCVEAAIPLDRFKWLYNIDTKDVKGRHATISYPNGEFGTSSWSAVATHYGSHLVANGRMGKLFLNITDPRGLKPENAKRPPLLLNSYVQAQIEGSTLENVYVIPRTALHDGNTLWLVDDEQKLNIKTVDIEWSDRYQVYIKNVLKPGSLLITSNINTPVVGLALQVD